jgi:hypothetical protein
MKKSFAVVLCVATLFVLASCKGSCPKFEISLNKVAAAVK